MTPTERPSSVLRFLAIAAAPSNLAVLYEDAVSADEVAARLIDAGLELAFQDRH